MHSYGVCVQNLVWNFKGVLWNWTQTFQPLHHKICISVTFIFVCDLRWLLIYDVIRLGEMGLRLMPCSDKMRISPEWLKGENVARVNGNCIWKLQPFSRGPIRKPMIYRKPNLFPHGYQATRNTFWPESSIICEFVWVFPKDCGVRFRNKYNRKWMFAAFPFEKKSLKIYCLSYTAIFQKAISCI